MKHESQASDLGILQVFYQHPQWFNSLQPIETFGLLLEYLRLINVLSINKHEPHFMPGFLLFRELLM